jgi:hypothetical protein
MHSFPVKTKLNIFHYWTESTKQGARAIPNAGEGQSLTAGHIGAKI